MMLLRKSLHLSELEENRRVGQDGPKMLSPSMWIVLLTFQNSAEVLPHARFLNICFLLDGLMV